MKNISTNEFYGFWTYSFNLSKDDLLDGGLKTSSEGFYIERNPEIIYLFTNLLTGAKVLVANKENVSAVSSNISEIEISIENILNIDKFKNYSFEFDDVDLFLNDIPNLEINEEDLREITAEDKDITDKFLANLSENDVDTLDLDFDDDTTKAFAVFENEDIAAIGRFYIIPTENGTMDITLVTSMEYRGRGHASSLVKKMLSLGIVNGHVPRYRVKQDNTASIKVAEKLGFKRYCHIQALYPPASEGN